MDTYGLSVRQVAWLSQISESLGKKYSKKEIDKLKRDLDKINQAAAKELTKEEAAVIYCASSTAYSSYQYWLKNYKRWYFALNYPEILEKYKEEEFDNLQLKNGSIALKSASSTNDWMDDLWNTTEDWWEDSSDALSDFWDENGDDILDVAEADARGAVVGFCTTANPQYAGGFAIFSSGATALEIWY